MLKLIPFILYRLQKYKLFLLAYVVLLPIVITISIYVTNNQTSSLYVGVVGDMELKESEEVEYTMLDTIPKDSELALSQYDAILVQEGQDITVLSTKGEAFDQALLAFIQGQIPTLQTNENQMYFASAIIGFLMLNIMNIGNQMYLPYFDEKNGTNKRIMSTSIHCWQYLLSYFVVILGALFIPAAIMVSGAILIFNISILMPLWQLLLILFLFCFFSAGFGLWMSTLCKSYEQIGAMASMVAIICAIVSGSIVPVTNNEWFNTLTQIVPQKHVMSIITALEKQTAMPYTSILYILGLSLGLIVLSIYIEKKKLPNR